MIWIWKSMDQGYSTIWELQMSLGLRFFLAAKEPGIDEENCRSLERMLNHTKLKLLWLPSRNESMVKKVTHTTSIVRVFILARLELVWPYHVLSISVHSECGRKPFSDYVKCSSKSLS
jgi:hypothetical protein